MYCLCVNVYCTATTGWQPNCSWQIYHIIYHIISYHIMSYHIMSYHIISCHIMSYHIISYHVISYHVISYHIMSYHIISYNLSPLSQNMLLKQSFKIVIVEVYNCWVQTWNVRAISTAISRHRLQRIDIWQILQLVQLYYIPDVAFEILLGIFRTAQVQMKNEAPFINSFNFTWTTSRGPG